MQSLHCEPTSGLVVHGLWPTYENGSWPQCCADSPTLNHSVLSAFGPDLHKHWPDVRHHVPASLGARRIAADLVTRVRTVISLWSLVLYRSSQSLVHAFQTHPLLEHEWRKHGTCSGLSPRQYIAAALALAKRLATPSLLLPPTSARGLREWAQDNGGGRVRVLSRLDVERSLTRDGRACVRDQPCDVVRRCVLPLCAKGCRVNACCQVLSCNRAGVLRSVNTCWEKADGAVEGLEQRGCPPTLLARARCHRPLLRVRYFA
jgi:hypothetical protein